MKNGFAALLLAAGLAGCGTTVTPVTHLNYHDSDPSAGFLADTTSWEWRRKGTPEPSTTSVQASDAEAAEFKKWRESSSASERSEFEEWRAWQEWKRKNPK